MTDQFPVPVDPMYVRGEAGASYVTGNWSNQSHLTLESEEAAKEFMVFAVLWPDRSTASKLSVTLHPGGALEISRPDGKRDFVRVDDKTCVVGLTQPSKG